ncbi:MAG TPA: class I SAM-dependent methyltransferase [Methylocella sp.]|nr:class I SAM-dependent methyltransferase [Methylocella sp.]
MVANPSNTISDQNEGGEDLDHVISSLTQGIHYAGSVSGAVLHELRKLARGIGGIQHSLETGCGRTTVIFSRIASNHLCFCYDDRNIDLPAGRLEETRSVDFVLDNPSFNKNHVNFIFGPTQITLQKYDFNETSLDFVFLDGPHHFPFVELEYYYLYPHIRKGGILGIDDIHFPTIANFFRFLRDDDMWRLISIIENTAFFERTDAPTFDPLGGEGGHPLQRYNALRMPAHPQFRRNLYLKYVKPRVKYIPPGLKKIVKNILSLQ